MSKLSPEARTVLEAARRNYRPSASDRERLREGVLKRVASVPATTEAEPDAEMRPTSTARPPRFTGMHALTAVGATALIAMGFVAVTTYTSSDSSADLNPPAPTGAAVDEALSDAPRPTEPASVAPPPVDDTATPLPPNPPPVLPRAAIEARATVSGAAATSKPTSRPTVSVPSADAPRAPVTAQDTLGLEMRILREAHAAFKRRDLAAAHGLLDEHARSYPRGVLREERLVLSTLVLCSEGHREEARRLADELVREHPRSAHLERLRGSCVADATFPPARTND